MSRKPVRSAILGIKLPPNFWVFSTFDGGFSLYDATDDGSGHEEGYSRDGQVWRIKNSPKEHDWHEVLCKLPQRESSYHRSLTGDRVILYPAVEPYHYATDGITYCMADARQGFVFARIWPVGKRWSWESFGKREVSHRTFVMHDVVRDIVEWLAFDRNGLQP